jgi:alpha-L-rhamnosidase
MKLSLTLFSILLSCQAVCQLQVNHLRTENSANPLGLGMNQPRFSWRLSGEGRNLQQSAYQLVVKDDHGEKWNSGKVSSPESLYVPYAGTPLESGKKYHWQVKIWDDKGRSSGWSQVASFAMGLLHAGDWKAKWIEPEEDPDLSPRPSPMLRKEFKGRKKVKSALAYITSHGLYEAWINGKRVGDAYFTPGWTSYNKRLQYQVYDVANLLQDGANAVGVTLGNGWYRGNLAWGGTKDIYGKDLGLLFQLEIEYQDGSRDRIVSDDSWKFSTGSILDSEIYHGEFIDARLEPDGWNKVGFDDSGWRAVRQANHDMELLVSTENEMVRKKEIFQPVKLMTTPKGERVIDFGQNLVGWVVVKAMGKAGDRVVLSHSEVLDKSGNFYTESLRAARQQNTYILKGNGLETFEPHFTWQGFRYIRVDEFPGDISVENFHAVALYSDLSPTGSFSCSNSLINQLQHNIQWGQRGNFLDVPTDCPQRDERLGWTGDAQAFSRTAAFNFDVHNFFSKWLKDLAADQLPNGSVPFVIPNVLGPGAAGSAGWADAATIIPWEMYQVYGDTRILENQYESMKSWVSFMENNSENFLWNKGFHFGDWLFYRPFDDNDGRSAVTDKYLISQSFFAHSAQLLLNAATVLGKRDDIEKYGRLLENVKKAFLQEYVTPSGRLVSGTQTAYVLALHFDMLPEALRESAVDRLVENIRSYDNHLTTGFLGTPYLCHVLSRFGRTQVAYDLLMQESYPSWLYPVKMGATTIWERWDGIKPDSTFQTPGMNSFNHYAYGAIGDWMYRVVAGIDLAGGENSQGYRRISIHPQPGGGLTAAAASLETPYGKLASSWKIENGEFRLEVVIPANTVAEITLPVKSLLDLKEGGMQVKNNEDFEITGDQSELFTLKTGSGSYIFSAPWTSEPD